MKQDDLEYESSLSCKIRLRLKKKKGWTDELVACYFHSLQGDRAVPPVSVCMHSHHLKMLHLCPPTFSSHKHTNIQRKFRVMGLKDIIVDIYTSVHFSVMFVTQTLKPQVESHLKRTGCRPAVEVFVWSSHMNAGLGGFLGSHRVYF